MYYRLDHDPSDARANYFEQLTNEHEGLLRSKIIAAKTLALPYIFTTEPDEDDGLVLLDYKSQAKGVMSKRLVAAIQSAGVDNLQLFPAEIKNMESGEVIHDYWVVNIIGMVSLTNLTASTSSPLAAGHYFHEIVLDTKDTPGFLMFRLKESYDIIVAEKVAQAIKEGDFTGVVLEPLKEASV